MNVGVHMSVPVSAFGSGTCPEVELHCFFEEPPRRVPSGHALASTAGFGLVSVCVTAIRVGAKCRLTVIFISMLMSDIEHHFIYFLAISISSQEEHSGFLPVLKEGCLFLLLSYTFWISIPQMCDLKILSPTPWVAFLLCRTCPLMHRVFHPDVIQFMWFFFFFYSLFFWCHIQDNIASSNVMKLFPLVSSAGFTVLGLPFRPQIHLR